MLKSRWFSIAFYKKSPKGDFLFLPNYFVTVWKETENQKEIVLRTSEEVLRDIKEHPERHRHNVEELTYCCMVGEKGKEKLDLALLAAHIEYVGSPYETIDDLA